MKVFFLANRLKYSSLRNLSVIIALQIDPCCFLHQYLENRQILRQLRNWKTKLKHSKTKFKNQDLRCLLWRRKLTSINLSPKKWKRRMILCLEKMKHCISKMSSLKWMQICTTFQQLWKSRIKMTLMKGMKCLTVCQSWSQSKSEAMLILKR